jgi:hypothetical protein
MLGDSTVSAVPPDDHRQERHATTTTDRGHITIPTMERSTAPGAPVRLRSVAR